MYDECLILPGTRAMNCIHLCLWKTLSQDCPRGEVAFSTSMCIYIVNLQYNNLLLKAKKKNQKIKKSNQRHHFTIVDKSTMVK